MERAEALVTIKEVAAEVLSVDPDLVTETRALQGRSRRRQPRPGRARHGPRGAVRHRGSRRRPRRRHHDRPSRRSRPRQGRARRQWQLHRRRRRSARSPRPDAGRDHRPRREDGGREPISTTFWSTLAAGQSTAAGIKRYDPSDLPVRFGCEVPDFDPTPYLGAEGGPARRPGHATRFRGRRRCAGRRGRSPLRPVAQCGDRRYRRRRPDHARGTGRHLQREGRGPGQPVPRADDDGERDRGHDRHAVRLEGPELLCRHRVRGERERDRRGGAAHP